MPASIYDPEFSEQYPLQMPWADRPNNLTPGTMPFKVYTSYTVCFTDVVPWLRWRWDQTHQEWWADQSFEWFYTRNSNSIGVGTLIGVTGEAGNVGYSYPTALLVGTGSAEPAYRLLGVCVSVRGVNFGETLVFDLERSQGGALIESITIGKLDLAGQNSSEYARNDLDIVIPRGDKPLVRYQGGSSNAAINDCTIIFYGKPTLPDAYIP